MRRLFIVVMCLLTVVAVGSAGIISVTNPSFELVTSPAPVPALSSCVANGGAGCLYTDWTTTTTYQGWTYGAGGNLNGIMQPGSTTTLFATIPDGVTVAFANSGDITQVVGNVLTSGDIYTLSVAVGREKGKVAGSVGSISLLVNGAAVSGVASACSPSVDTNWTTCTYTYTSTGSDVGKSLTIDLKAGSVPQAAFDNVSLTDTPEPGTFALFGLGLLAVTRLSRRKTAK